MSRGRRYEEPKLNLKKVFAVILAFVVIIMSIFVIHGILSKEEKTGGITSKTYFSAYKDNKWGVIDENGDTVIEPSYEEMIIIPDNKTDIFLCTYDVNFDTGEYSTKALNSENQEIFTYIDFERAFCRLFGRGSVCGMDVRDAQCNEYVDDRYGRGRAV